MKTATSNQGYGIVAKSLHWLLFALLTAQYIVGSVMPHIGRRTQDEGLVAWHVSIGAAILFFIVLRIVWRVARPVPLLTTMPVWQRHLARLTHVMLYLLVLAMVLLGWAASGFYGWPVKLFGVIPLPALVAKGAALGHTAGDIHDWLDYVLLGVIALHVAGALYHYFVAKDRVLQRMLPSL